MKLTAEQATRINGYIQPLRGKFIDRRIAVETFPELQPAADWSKEAEKTPHAQSKTYCLFVDGKFSHQVEDYDQASDFLLDTPNSQGFQFGNLQGLSVCADQAR